MKTIGESFDFYKQLIVNAELSMWPFIISYFQETFKSLNVLSEIIVNLENKQCILYILLFFLFLFFFFYLSRTLTIRRILPLPPTHKHSDIYLLLFTWDDYLVCVCLCPSSWMISSVYHESRHLYYRTVQPWHVEGMGQYDFAKFRCRWNFCYPPNWKENDIRRHALVNEWIRYNTT